MKGNVSVQLIGKDGNIKKTVEGHNAICSHINTAAYTELIGQYTAPDGQFKDDFAVVTDIAKAFSGPSAFQTLYLSDATSSDGALQLGVPGNILATCPFANTTENIASHVGAWDSVYSHRSLKSVSRTYRFGQETFEGIVGTIGWMSEYSTRKARTGISICSKLTIQYVQYIGDGKLVIVAYKSSPEYVACPEGIGAVRNSNGTINIKNTNYWQIPVGYFIFNLDNFSYTEVASDYIYWFNSSATDYTKGYPSTSLYSCDGRYLYFYDGCFRRSKIDLQTGIAETNNPTYKTTSGEYKLMVWCDGSSSYTAGSSYYTWKSDNTSYYIRSAVYSGSYGSYSSVSGGSNRLRNVYVNNDVIYSGYSTSGTHSSTYYYCNIVSATRLEDDYLGCGLYDCYIADGVNTTGKDFETRKFYLGLGSWTGWFSVGGDYIYMWDTVSSTYKKMPLTDFMSELEECTIGNDVYLNLVALENAQTTLTSHYNSTYICDEYKCLIETNSDKLQRNGHGLGVFICSKSDTQCTSVYVLNEQLNKTFDDTLVVKYTISFDPSELLI